MVKVITVGDLVCLFALDSCKGIQASLIVEGKISLGAEVPRKVHKEEGMDSMRVVEGRSQGKCNTIGVAKGHTKLVVPFI